MTSDERDLLVSLVTAVVRLARNAGFEQTADDVLDAARIVVSETPYPEGKE